MIWQYIRCKQDFVFEIPMAVPNDQKDSICGYKFSKWYESQHSAFALPLRLLPGTT